ncbi:MAG: hypothetical protein JXA89_22410 [Anaerolineae bacterium]|nr:hypothetical protein [Anaerolineae bacterium]
MAKHVRLELLTVVLIALMPAIAAGQALPGGPGLPPDWRVTASTLADVTGDGAAEWVLVVWRPWRDWPIQQWSTAPSPIAGFHDPAGDSCHLILLDPKDGREIWAGSALPVPFLNMVVDDVDGDGANEVLVIEGSYATSRDGPGRHVGVWHWNGFGFTMAWRSAPGRFDPSCLADAGRCGIEQDMKNTFKEVKNER